MSLLTTSMIVAEDAEMEQICATLTFDSGTVLANTIIVEPYIPGKLCTSLAYYFDKMLLWIASADLMLTMNFTFTESSIECLNLSIIDDTLVEGNATFPVILTLVTTGVGVTLETNSSGTITITDNEGDSS